MFTGIVQEIGRVVSADRADDLLRLTIQAPHTLARAQAGDSIAVDGVCLTVVTHDRRTFVVEAMAVTLEGTTLGSLGAGAAVNIERALAAGDPLGGHIVQGHVDGVGRVVRLERATDSLHVDVAVPAEVAAVTVLRGSIALAGVSLTVSGLPAPGVVRVSLIPYTQEHTTLGRLREGTALNVEADLVAKLVSEQTRRWLEARGRAGSTEAEEGLNALGGRHGVR